MTARPSLARRLAHMLRPIDTVDAHCDLMCGVYNPAQARIEAESVHQIAVKYHDSSDETFRQRCVIIKEERAELVKHHLSVLWTDYFKPNHLEEYPQLHELFWNAIKAAGGPLVEKRNVQISAPIKKTGSHTVAIDLHPDVVARVTIEVVPS